MNRRQMYAVMPLRPEALIFLAEHRMSILGHRPTPVYLFSQIAAIARVPQLSLRSERSVVETLGRNGKLKSHKKLTHG